jgi:hypothetical protein
VADLKGRRFEVVWDGHAFAGVIQSVDTARRTLDVMYLNDAEVTFDPNLPLDGPNGFLEGGYRLVDE